MDPSWDCRCLKFGVLPCDAMSTNDLEGRGGGSFAVRGLRYPSAGASFFGVLVSGLKQFHVC